MHAVYLLTKSSTQRHNQSICSTGKAHGSMESASTVQENSKQGRDGERWWERGQKKEEEKYDQW